VGLRSNCIVADLAGPPGADNPGAIANGRRTIMRNVLRGHEAHEVFTVYEDRDTTYERAHVPPGGEWGTASATIPLDLMKETEARAKLVQLRHLVEAMDQRITDRNARYEKDGSVRTATVTIDGHEYTVWAEYYLRSGWGNWGFFGPVPFLPEGAGVRIFLGPASLVRR
jgi:hypothetical protein